MKNNTFSKHSAGAALITAILALNASAATFGTVALEGTVAPINAIVVTPVTGHDSLDLVTGATDLQVATANESNNDPLGYTVTLQSLNAGAGTQAKLNGTGGNTETVSYTMKYGAVGAEASVTLVAGSAVVTDANAATSVDGADKSLLISFAGAWKNADTYSDTITLTIAAK